MVLYDGISFESVDDLTGFNPANYIFVKKKTQSKTQTPNREMFQACLE